MYGTDGSKSLNRAVRRKSSYREFKQSNERPFHLRRGQVLLLRNSSLQTYIMAVCCTPSLTDLQVAPRKRKNLSSRPHGEFASPRRPSPTANGEHHKNSISPLTWLFYPLRLPSTVAPLADLPRRSGARRFSGYDSPAPAQVTRIS